jgi:methionyl-tRNA formyltransferase
MKMVFMGSDPIVLPVLEFLYKEKPGDFQLHAVYTQPDRRTGRGMHLKPNAIKEWATANGIKVLQPLKCGPDDAAYLAANEIDLVVAMAYGQILPRSFLGVPPRGVLNLHASLLPRLRGASPIHTAVAQGNTETGLCLMEIIPKLDAGPVADLERVDILPGDTLADIQAKLAHAGPSLMARALPKLAEAQLTFVEQDASKVTYCRIIEKTDCHLDFHRPAKELCNRVRAFQPWPGTTFPYGDTEIRILEAKAEESGEGGVPGSLVVESSGSLAINCGCGMLRVTRLQRPGGKPMAVEAFLRGFPMTNGCLVESRPMRPLEASEPFPYKRK